MPDRAQVRKRFLSTVLMTDIVGSTEHAAELGDSGWRDLVQMHHALVRAALRRHGGREGSTPPATASLLSSTLQGTDPAAASVEWAALDRRGVDLALEAPLHNPGADFVSERVGNYQVHPHGLCPLRPDVGPVGACGVS